MKKFLKIIGWLLVILLLFIGAGIIYIKVFLPNVGAAPVLNVERTAERLARGEYLATHVTNCIACHSTRDWTRFAGPPLEESKGMGGERFDHKIGFPGVFYAKNITPEGISRYTDGELFRVITTGVTKEGKAMFPVMPYHYYGRMDPEDIYSIIAYIRTLKPIKNNVPDGKPDFPMNIILNTIPEKAELTKMPANTDIVNYGKYLVNAAACLECHTQFEKGQLVKGTEYGGGREFPFPNGTFARSGNITPDRETGIGSWNETQFISIFHSRSDSMTLNTKLKPDDFNTVMPWNMLGKMKDEDLKAIYTYLRTVKPIKNTVIKFSRTTAKD